MLQRWALMVGKRKKAGREQAAALPNKLGELVRTAERGVALLYLLKIVRHIVLQNMQIWVSFLLTDWIFPWCPVGVFPALHRGLGGKVPWCSCCGSCWVICKGSDWAVCKRTSCGSFGCLLEASVCVFQDTYLFLDCCCIKCLAAFKKFKPLQKNIQLVCWVLTWLQGRREGGYLLALWLLEWGGSLCLHASHILGGWQGHKLQGRALDTV